MDVMLSPLTKPLNALCVQSTKMVGKYLKELNSRGEWPHFGLSYTSVFEVVRRGITQPIRQFCDSPYCGFCSERDFKFADELRLAKAAFVQKNGGLCLDCVLTRRDFFWTSQCCIMHKG